MCCCCTSKDRRDSEEERGEPQRFKFLCQTTYWRHRHTGATCRPIRSRHCADMTQDGLRIADTLGGGTEVVYPGLFSLFLLRKHFITEFFFKKKSGDVNYEANFSFLILLHKRAKPAPPLTHPPIPCLRPYLTHHLKTKAEGFIESLTLVFIKPFVKRKTFLLPQTHSYPHPNLSDWPVD